jgi:hypothetical protein
MSEHTSKADEAAAAAKAAADDATEAAPAVNEAASTAESAGNPAQAEVQAETAVVPKGETALAEIPDYGTYAQEYGTEEFDQDGVLRFIKLLQRGSDECIEGTDAHIPEAQPGQWFNPNSGRLYTNMGVCFLGRDHHYNEWVEVDAGGGFVQRLEIGDPRIEVAKRISGKQVGRLKAPDANGQPIPTHEIVECIRVPVIIFDLETWDAIDSGVLTIERSKFPPYNQYISRLKQAHTPSGKRCWGNVPLFGYRVVLGSELETKPKVGKPYYYPTFVCPVEDNVVKSLLPMSHPLFEEALKAVGKLREGTVRMETAEEAGRQEDGPGAGAVDVDYEVVDDKAGATGPDDLPF